MNTPLAILAAVLSALALYLPTQSQAFTRAVVDGRSLRMFVSGSGDATVVLENGFPGPLENWTRVQRGVSRFARTVSYDRAGVGFSEAGARPRDARRIARELREALRSAGLSPPYVIAGASLGGFYTRVFAGMYPEDVTALVLVDPSPDSMVATSTAPEARALPDTIAQARASRLPDIPVFLIDATSHAEVPFASEGVRRMRTNNRIEIESDSAEYRKLLDTIPGSRLIVTDQSGHNVMLEQPELVVETIRNAIDAAAQRVRR